MLTGEPVFVDTGAWIALAVTSDPLHERARDRWAELTVTSARLFTSVPVVIETFTYLDRKGSRALAVRWRESLGEVRRLQVLGCSSEELAEAHRFFDRRDFHKLSLVDATSFVLMKRHKIRRAFAFDVHFGVAGFRFV